MVQFLRFLGARGKAMISAAVVCQAQFYDLDPMQVVWHGNYARFLEQARTALMEKIGYSFAEMAESGFIWPIVDMRLKYVRPVTLRQEIEVTATLTDYQHSIRIEYRIADRASGEVLTKAHTVQAAVSVETQELSLESPAMLVERVEALL
jgi:acyl-CoA thioester hydrolase